MSEESPDTIQEALEALEDEGENAHLGDADLGDVEGMDGVVCWPEQGVDEDLVLADAEVSEVNV